ncbi:g3151 [Coccomyxa elongata]
MSTGRCAPHNTVLRHRAGVNIQIKPFWAHKSFPGIAAKIAWRRDIVRALASQDSGEQTAELRQNQKELEETLAELAKVANRLSEEDQKKLAAVIADLGPLEDGQDSNSEGGQTEYPKPVQDLYNMAGVLDAVPYDGSPVIKDSKDLPLMPELSRYQWSEKDVRDTGEELTDEEWAKFFANELGYNADDDSNDGGEGTSPEDFRIPPSFLDDEVKPGDDVEIEPSPDVEAMLALLESGQPLPPDPREAGIARESAAAFTARLDKIVARYESQFLKRHEWQITTKEIREMEEHWNALAMTSQTPATMDDITEVVPAPDFPPEVKQQWDRCQWILYRLRRAHLDGPPAQPAQALAAAGLVSEDVIFQDAVLECRGLPAWLEYAQRLEQTGGYIELANIWGSASEDRPDPQWHVVVDSWLNIPYPDWYLDYFMTHFDASRNPQAFLGAFAAAMADSGKETPEYLKEYAEWAEAMRRPPKRQKRVPLLSRDAYEGRPLSFKQRLRTGSVPVVEANPNLSIDDTDAQGRPLPGVERPSSTSSSRAADFVADPGMGEAFSRAARDQYGGGRNLLLPLFRRLQQRSARLLSLLQLIKSVLHTANGGSTPAVAAASTNRAPYASSNQESTSDTSRGQGHQGDCDVADHVRTSETGIKEQKCAEVSNTGAQPSSRSQAEKQRYKVSADEAVDAAGKTVKEWQRQRAEHISWRSTEASSTGGGATDTPSQAAESAGQGASILEELRSSWRKVKPGVSVWAGPGTPLHLDALLPQLSELAAQGDIAAQQLLDLAQKREPFLYPERPKQTAIVGHSPKQAAPSASQMPGAVPDLARIKAAVSPGDEQEAAVFSAVAQRMREKHRGRGNSQPEHRRSRWSRRSLSRCAEGGPGLRVLGLADLSASNGRVRVVADGEAAFASVTGGRPKAHRYRLLLPYPRSALTEQTRLQIASDSALASTPTGDLGARVGIGNDAASAGSQLQQQQQQQQGSSGGRTGAQGGQAPSGSAAAAAAARLGLRPGAGSRYFPPEPAALPAIPDLVGLFLGDSADSTDISDDGSADVSIDSSAGSNTAESTASSGEVDAQAGGSMASQKNQRSRSSGGMAEEKGDQQAPLGMAWRDGRYLTIPMTTLYEFNVETGQVDRITCHWNGIIAHVLGGPEDARDVYVRQIRLHDLMYRPGFRVCYRDLDLTTIPAEEAMDMS